MIELGFILPTGEEIDLQNYFNLTGSVHLQYLKEYIAKLEKEDPETYQKWRVYSWNWLWNRHSSRTACEDDFAIHVLKWIKVGVYSAPAKILTYAYFSVTEHHTRNVGRMKIIDEYEKAGYVSREIRGRPIEDFEDVEEPPEDYPSK